MGGEIIDVWLPQRKETTKWWSGKYLQIIDGLLWYSKNKNIASSRLDRRRVKVSR